MGKHAGAIGVTRIPDAELADALDASLGTEANLEYANFQPIADRVGAVAGLHRRRWLDSADRIAVLQASDAHARPVALLRAVHRSFESAHFDLKMARIEAPIGVAEQTARFAALRVLYPTMLEHLAELGYAHVGIRTSSRDPAAGWAAQDAGGTYVDTQVSWMCSLTRTPHDEPTPAGLAIELHDRHSMARQPAECWARVAKWAGEAFDRGPFVFDMTLPRVRAMGIYSEWTARVMRGEWADAVMVARHEGEVVAFISMLYLADVSEAADLKVCGRGLGATLPEYRGLFTAIQREMIARRPLDADYMENETQVATIGSLNVYAKLGMRYLRSTSTFHRRLDRRSRPASS